jgi:glutathione S-transferase
VTLNYLYGDENMDNIRSLRLRYFPFTGRAEPIRDALRIGAVTFEDAHIPPEQFSTRRAAGEFPFGGLPVLDIETTTGKFCVAQSNAILRLAGRLSGLYPVDDLLRAMKVDEVLDVGEDINQAIAPSLHEPDVERKMAMRKLLAEKTLPEWATYLERTLIANGNNGFCVGDSLSIADLKLYWIVDWLTSGMLDGIPANWLDRFPAVVAWRKNIAAVRATRLSQGAV